MIKADEEISGGKDMSFWQIIMEVNMRGYPERRIIIFPQELKESAASNSAWKSKPNVLRNSFKGRIILQSLFLALTVSIFVAFFNIRHLDTARGLTAFSPHLRKQKIR